MSGNYFKKKINFIKLNSTNLFFFINICFAHVVYPLGFFRAHEGIFDEGRGLLLLMSVEILGIFSSRIIINSSSVKSPSLDKHAEFPGQSPLRYAPIKGIVFSFHRFVLKY